MAFIGYFFLMRSGEYTGLPHAEDIHQCPLFRLQDVQLWIGTQRLLHLQCPLADLALATFASLTFTNQKSGVRGEVIGHQCSGHQHACPVRAIAQRILYLRKHNAHSTPHPPPQWPPPQSPLDVHYGHQYHRCTLCLCSPHRIILRFSSL